MRKLIQWNYRIFFVAGMTLLGGCSTFLAVKDQQEQASRNAVISGTVGIEEAMSGPIIIGLVDVAGKDPNLVDYFVTISPGRWIFAAEPGTYKLVAFVDLNSNVRYDDEPAYSLTDSGSLEVGPGETTSDINLLIPTEGRFKVRQFTIEEVMDRNPVDQQRISLYSLCSFGEVTTLEDERFDRKHAQAGMWRFYDFVLERRCGVYFLKPYDDDKIPVLFVHGIMGTPLDFEEIIGQLDTSRFQPWVYYYPSGATLENVSAVLLQILTRLKLDYNYSTLHVVAHSMGGLVARDLVLLASEGLSIRIIDKFVTISSPFEGMTLAGKGVEKSPVVLHSWRGLDPKGEFLNNLFHQETNGETQRRRIPDDISYHMLFGYKGSSGDGIVTIASQLRYEAQSEADSIRGFDEDHTSILRSPEAIGHINAILGK